MLPELRLEQTSKAVIRELIILLSDSDQGGEGKAGRSGETYTNNYPIAFSAVVESCIAVHMGTQPDVNVVVEPYWASYFVARGSYTISEVGIAYIAIGW